MIFTCFSAVVVAFAAAAVFPPAGTVCYVCFRSAISYFPLIFASHFCQFYSRLREHTHRHAHADTHTHAHTLIHAHVYAVKLLAK